MRRDPIRTLARLRALREDQARQELAAATAGVTAARERLDDARARLRAPRPPVVDALGLDRERTIAVALTDAAETAANDVLVATEAQTRAVELWQRRRAEQRAVDRLVDRRDDAERARRAVREQAEADVLALLARGREVAR